MHRNMLLPVKLAPDYARFVARYLYEIREECKFPRRVRFVAYLLCRLVNGVIFKRGQRARIITN